MTRLLFLLALCPLAVMAGTPSYWFGQLQSKPDAKTAQEFWFVAGTNILMTYKTNHVIINVLGGTNTGPPGPQGPQGIQGIPGTNGVDGVNGTNGVDGVNGTNGVNGLNGTNGATGPQGPAGIPSPLTNDLDYAGFSGTNINRLVASNTITATNGFYYRPVNSAGIYTNLLQPMHAFAALMGYFTNTINGGANTYAVVTNYQTARTNAMTCGLASGIITNTLAGLYWCGIHMSMKSLDNGALVEGDLLINGVERDEISFQSEFDPGSPRYKGVSAFGIIYIPANSQITFQIKSSGANGVTVRRSQLVVMSP